MIELFIANFASGFVVAFAAYYFGHANGRLYQMQRDDEDYRRENYEARFNVVTGQRLIPDLPIGPSSENNGYGPGA